MKNDIVHGICSDITVDGQGVVKVGSLVIFVKDLIPGEEADIKIVSLKKNYAYGIIDKLTKPSTNRIDSICPISYKCGGCDFRYIDYDYQLVLKKQLLENTFRSLDVEVLDVIRSEDSIYYRNKSQIPIRDHKFGFYRHYSNDIVEFQECYIQSQLTNSLFNFIKNQMLELNIDKYFRHIVIKHAFNTNQVMVGLVSYTKEIPLINDLIDSITKKFSEVKSIVLNINNKETNVILGEEDIVLYGNSYIIDEFDNLRFKISLKSFYQTNYKQMINLYSKVKEYAYIDSSSNVLDLYSGIGTISLYLSRYAKHVTGVEIVEDAVKNADENKRLNNIANVDFYLDDASKNFKNYIKGIDVLIVDPPRKGLSKELINELNSSNIDRIVYVSCNPATLARDLELFKTSYSFDRIQPVDMFPYTKHIECVVSMQRKDNK